MRNEIKTWNGLELADSISDYRISGYKKNGAVGIAVLIQENNGRFTDAVIDSETENYFRVAGRLFSKKGGTERNGSGLLFVSDEKLKNTFRYLEHRNRIARKEEQIKSLRHRNSWDANLLADAERVSTATIERVENFTPYSKRVEFRIAGKGICEVTQRKEHLLEAKDWDGAEVSMTGTRYTAEFATLAPLAIAEAFRLCDEWNREGQEARNQTKRETIAKRNQDIKTLEAEIESLKAIQ
jgi:hypothetical protein